MRPDTTKPARFFLRAARAFALSVAALFLLLLAAYALPGGAVRRNLLASAATIQREGLYPEFFGFKLFQMDNYTDTIMLFEAATADETDPLTAMMTNTAYNVDNFETLADDLQTYLEARAAGEPLPDSLEPFSYARYWHGYLIWLRPLLCLMPYAGVRVVQYLVLAALFALVLAGLWRRAGPRVAVWFAVSQLLVSVFFVPHQVQFFTCFFIAYAGCAWVLARERDVWSLSVGLIVLGVATAFCDLLVTPILTLGLPMACWLLCVAQRLVASPRQCAAVVGGSLCWGVGYGGCWALKWGAGRACDRAGRHRRRAAPDRGAYHRRYLARHRADLGQHLPICVRHAGRPRAVLAAGRGLRAGRGAVCGLCARQGCARPGAAARVDGADGPGLALPAAHPLDPARLVHLARAGRRAVRRPGVPLLRLQLEGGGGADWKIDNEK